MLCFESFADCGFRSLGGVVLVMIKLVSVLQKKRKDERVKEKKKKKKASVQGRLADEVDIEKKGEKERQETC